MIWGKQKAQFGFFLPRIEHLLDKLRIFNLGKADFLKLNLNTKTCPGFRTTVDTIITLKLYSNATVLIDEVLGQNYWGAYYIRLVHYGDHSNEISMIPGNSQLLRNEIIYEPKMFWQYDHSFSSYEKCTTIQIVNGQPIATSDLDKINPQNKVIGRYYTDKIFKNDLFGKYSKYNKNLLILWRDVSNSTN